MIELINITKKYDSTVLNNINYTFYAGNIYVVKGISGSGKTTLFNIISGLDFDYKGEVIYDGEKLLKKSDKIFQNYRQKIGYIFQDSLLIHHMTIIDNLLFIVNDKDKIIKLSKEYNVDHLLDKMPNQISGGERQRFSLIRALLCDSEIILADEPTSSLDFDNSQLFVKTIKKLKNQNKIVIINTHKNIYDDIADCILDLDYGNLNIVKEKKTKKKVSLNNSDFKYKNNFKYDMKYIIGRRKEHSSRTSILLLFLLILITFFTVTIKFNFKDSYVKLNSKNYPYNVLTLKKYDYEKIKYFAEKTYDEYKIVTKDYNAYILPDKKDSNLNIKGVISVGSFPSNKNEVLVNKEYVERKYPNKKLQTIIGNNIKIKDMNFTISGIVEKNSDNYYYLYGCNDYYFEIDNGSLDYEVKSAIFIPYDSMKSIGEKVVHEDMKLTVFPSNMVVDLYSGNFFDENSEPFVGNYIDWKCEIENISSNAVFFANISLIILIVISLISILFISSQINLDLYYRKRELGYLQLFKIKKSRIFLIVVLEYLFNVFLAFLLSLIAFNIFTIILYFLIGIELFLSIHIILIIILLFLLYSFIIILFPLIKYLRYSIIKLIRY